MFEGFGIPLCSRFRSTSPKAILYVQNMVLEVFKGGVWIFGTLQVVCKMSQEHAAELPARIRSNLFEGIHRKVVMNTFTMGCPQYSNECPHGYLELLHLAA
jgi:hypothetical protein